MATARLIIKDEVNVKIEGLGLPERKELTSRFKYEIPGAKYQPSVRLGRWDGKVSFFSLGGATYINLLPEILPYLNDRGYEIELVDMRTYATQFSFNQITEETFTHKVWPEKHPFAGQPVVLRDYQIEIINTFLSDPQCIQEIATGAGKTLMTAGLSYSCEPYGKTLVIVPNKSLVTQTEEDYRNLGLDVGVYYGDRKEFGKTHTICTWQSINYLAKNAEVNTEPSTFRLLRDPKNVTIHDVLDGVVAVIVDEVHMAKAEVLKTMLTGVMAHVPLRWGLTGTVPKELYASTSLRCCIGDVVGKLGASDLQDQGVLANCHVNILQMVDYVEYRDYQSELKYLLENDDRLEYISNLVEKIKEDGNTLVLVDRVAPGMALVQKIKDSVFVSGRTKVNDRKDQYDEVATSDNKVIVATYGVASVGINIPRIFNLVLVEPGKSFVRVIQSIGRGIRKAEDKDFVQVWDVTSTCKFAKRHLTARKKFYTDANYPFTIKKVNWK